MTLPKLPNTDRLRVRPWSFDDIPRLFEIYADPRVTRFLPSLRAESLDQVRARHPELMATTTRYGRGFGVWAVERRRDGLVIGAALLKPAPGLDGALSDEVEVGWHLDVAAWGRGYATEIGGALLRYGFETLNLDAIIALADPDNAASIAVMRRLGMEDKGWTEAYYDGQRAALYRNTAARWRRSGARRERDR